MKLQARAAFEATFGVAAAVPAITGERVAVRERADIGCVLLTAAVDVAQVVYPANVAVGVDLPLAPGRVHRGSGRTAVWLSPRSWLVHCTVEEEGELVRRVNGAFAGKLLHAARFTDALCWLELSGSGALGLLTEGGFVSLEQAGLAIGYAKRTLVAQVAVIVLRESENVWLVAVERSRVRYFMDWLRAAAE
jgi:heterotetrameric sarcosine oxidase gamma subunit